jgi:ATP-dependent DNA helicase RecG
VIQEGQHCDKKSLRALNDKAELVKDIIGFANADGGYLYIGIEDDASAPSPAQHINPDQINTLRKRILELSINVTCGINKVLHENGGEYILINIHRNESVPASTTSGGFYIRGGDNTLPLNPNNLAAFMKDRAAYNWELVPTSHGATDYDPELFRRFVNHIRASDRASNFVKSKTDNEFLEYYHFVRDGKLTHLGVLCIGAREQRTLLGTAPIVQCIKYDAHEQKIQKWLWDDNSLTPWELVDAIWRTIPEWQESYEIPDGLFRKHIPVYDEVVVRELIVNALVHRPYTQAGDIFIKLFPDRLEIHNPGGLPPGVTPQNILHMTVKRNPSLAKVFLDLGLMELEGSGYDRMYEVLLSSGKKIPEVVARESVKVTVSRTVVDRSIIDFIAKADQAYQLTQKERITLGLLAQTKMLTVMQLTKELKLSEARELNPWIGTLVTKGLISTQGNTRGKKFAVSPEALKSLNFQGMTTLGAVGAPRLRALILEDLAIHKEGLISEIHERVGQEISRDRIRGMLKELILQGTIEKRGGKKFAVYALKSGSKACIK